MKKIPEIRYTDEQIMIRAMPCPKCFAQPRELCKRKPTANGIVRNHEERMHLFHDHVKECSFGDMYFQTHSVATTKKRFDELEEYNSLLEPYE
tara:strand:+ start:945 stop:1223 length:279 start_codon:yes stop_codon:yes gene_type:complete